MILYYDIVGSDTDKVIVLLHGIAGSSRYWQPLIPFLPKNHRIISIDLLGFGRSPKPKNVTYDYATHLQSIDDTLESIGVKRPFTLAGHSMGALLALRFARLHPKKVSQLLLIAMPVYINPQAAHLAITQSSYIKELAYYGWTSQVLCTTWCRILRPLSRLVAPFYLTSHSHAAAQDSVLHSWQSYSQSLSNIIENQTVKFDLSQLNLPIKIIYGNQDLDCRPNEGNILTSNIRVQVLEGGHQIVHTAPKLLASALIT